MTHTNGNERMTKLLNELEHAADMVMSAVFLACDPNLAEIRAQVAFQKAREYFFSGWAVLLNDVEDTAPVRGPNWFES